MAEASPLFAITKALVDENKEQGQTLTNMSVSLSRMNSNFSAFIETMKGEKLKGREEAIEGGAKKKNKGSQDTSIDLPTAGLFAGIGAAVAALTGTLGTIVAGFSGAVIASLDETMNDISRTFASAWLGMGNKLKAFFKMFSGEGIIGIAIVKLIEALRGPAAVFDEVAQRWRNIETGRFMKAPNIIGRAINRIADAFGGAGKTLSGLFGEGTKFGKAMSALKSAFTFAEDSKILKLLQGFGGVLKKIFLPIGLIFTAYDTIKGAIEGYEEEGFVGALTGAVSGLLGSIVGAPLNLIKSITLWIGKKLGILSEEDAAKFDEAFDFEQMIKDFGMAIAKTINKIIDWITNFDVGQAVSDGWEAFKNFVKGDPNADKPNDGTETLEIPGANNGTVGAFGKLFANFGKGTPVVAHGEEAIVPKDSEHGKVLQDYEKNKGGKIDYAASWAAYQEENQGPMPSQAQQIMHQSAINAFNSGLTLSGKPLNGATMPVIDGPDAGRMRQRDGFIYRTSDNKPLTDNKPIPKSEPKELPKSEPKELPKSEPKELPKSELTPLPSGAKPKSEPKELPKSELTPLPSGAKPKSEPTRLPSDAKPKPLPGSMIPEGMGNTLGQIMTKFQDSGIMKATQQKGTELKAKEDAMRAAGASDMDIAQSMMGEMPSMMGNMKSMFSAAGFDQITMPKMKSNPIKEAIKPNNIGNVFGSMVREAEENKKAQATRAPAPVIISDNSTKSSSTSNTAMPVISKPFDFDDPFVSGIGRTRMI
jgi:hypothetical protein